MPTHGLVLQGVAERPIVLVCFAEARDPFSCGDLSTVEGDRVGEQGSVSQFAVSLPSVPLPV